LISVPRVVGYPEKDAKAILARSGFGMRVAGEEASNYREGTVARQDPEAGKPATRGSTVVVWTAAAPLVTVPEVRRRSIKEAEAMLARSGLRMRMAGEEASSYPEGTVARQDPDARKRVTKGTVVSVWTSVPQPVIVPEVRKRPLEEAEAMLERAQLRMRVAGKVVSRDREGTVVRQDPVARARVTKGTVVSVWTAVAQPVTVPELRKRPLGEAEAILERAELRMRVAGEVESSYPAGTVVRQDPSAERRVDKGSVVTVWVAKATPVTVPDLKGLSIDAARQRLRDSRLRLGATSTRPTLPPRGEIIEHEPLPGAEVEAGSLVNVTVGDGSQVRVPRIVGAMEQAALETLKTPGLRPGARSTEQSDAQKDRVLRQRPEEGTIVARGSPVDYWVAVPVTVTVPRIEGLRAHEALAELESLRLVGEQAGSDASPRPEGEIVRQEPAAGSRIPRGSRVVFWVASPELVVVPDLSGMRGPNAVESLRAEGLVAGEVVQEESQEAEGTVIRQNPQPGQSVPRGTRVSYRVASPLLVRVPSLVNLSLDGARRELVAVRLAIAERPAERHNASKGTVIGQEPAAGTRVVRGTEVTVRISAGPLLPMPWVIGGGIGAVLLAAGAGLLWTRRQPRGSHLAPATKPEVRVRLEEREVDAEQGVNLDQNAPEVRIRTRFEPGESEVSAEQLVAREEWRKS
jgi:beta-lactam-binding protein with PASTA domain